MTKEETKSIDETINTLQDQIMYLSHEIVEKKCRETYIDTMSEIIRCLMVDLERASSDSLYSKQLNDLYKIKPKEQERLKKSFLQTFNNNFDQTYRGAKQ